MAIKYRLDEHIAPAIAPGRRQRGIDVTTTLDHGLGGASDLQQLAYGLSQGRVLVACDSDFLGLAAAGLHIAASSSGQLSIGVLGRLFLTSRCRPGLRAQRKWRGRIEFL